MPSMLINGPSSYYPIRNPMDHRIIRVRFQKKWCPIEFNRCIELLYVYIYILIFNINLYLPKVSLILYSLIKEKEITKYELSTLAVKTVRESKVAMDLASSGIRDWRRQTIETNCPLFRESPTNIILFPLRASSIRLALKLHFFQKGKGKYELIQSEFAHAIHKLVDIDAYV